MSPEHGIALSEVARNLRSSVVRTAILMILATVTGAAICGATRFDLERIAEQQRHQIEAGSTSFQIVGPGGARVDARRCAAASAIDGVIAAGGIWRTEAVSLPLQPSDSFQLVSATPGFIAAAWPTLGSASKSSVVLGPKYADYGARPGSTLTFASDSTTSGRLHVDAVASIPATIGLDRSIVVTAPAEGRLDSCLVRSQPNQYSNVGAALRGWFGDGTSVQEVLLRSDLNADPQRLLEQRPSGYGWLVAGLMLLIVASGAWVSRRSEFALYRLLGFRESSLVLMLVAETTALLLIPAQLGAVAAIGGAPTDQVTAAALVFDWVRFDLLVVLAPLVGLIAMPRRSVVATLKGL
jgi:hypothetical protein